LTAVRARLGASTPLGLTPQANHLSRLRRWESVGFSECEPRSGDIWIAWGVSPRNDGSNNSLSGGAATVRSPIGVV